MLERLLVAGTVIALLTVAIALGRRWYEARNARIEVRLRQSVPAIAGAGRAVAPRIVYFTTRTCVVCKAQQEPAMAALRQRVQDLVVERHDAVEERSLADEYGVLSVPTTAVYDRQGQLVTVNRGFTPAAVLLAQVEGTEPSLEGGAEMSSEPVAPR
ncbi:MAG: thioredoxin family protein [Dehalococcoidia bacterium]|nr:thioredoxin family protein [Dehalococcoidia bacterium]